MDGTRLGIIIVALVVIAIGSIILYIMDRPKGDK